MVLYNTTDLINATDMGKLFIYANDSTGGGLGGLFIIGLFIVFLMVLKRFTFLESITASSFICFLISLMMNYVGFLNIRFSLVFLTLAAFGTFMLYMKQQ